MCPKDLIAKWRASCETIGDVREKLTVEQLLSTTPDDVRVWVSERKPATAAEAGQLAELPQGTETATQDEEYRLKEQAS